jgi:hypothetical protein
MSPENKALLERHYKVLPAHIAPHVVDFSTLDNLMRLARAEERERVSALVKAEADRYARCYQPGSDGRNTFTMFGDAILALFQKDKSL